MLGGSYFASIIPDGSAGLASLEIRHDADGEYYHLITAWKATNEEEQSYAENV
jgi:hypothetical protein